VGEIPVDPPRGRSPPRPSKPTPKTFTTSSRCSLVLPVAVVLLDGETLRGTLEWYDQDCIKLTRYGSPNLLIFKHSIKFMYKDGEDAAQGGTNAS
jgi:sRNA-binding regulator protein Hfq